MGNFLNITFEPPSRALRSENFHSSLGYVVGLTDEENLWALGFGKDPSAVECSLKAQFPQTQIFSKKGSPSSTFQKLEIFFEDPSQALCVPLSLKLSGTPFQEKVWHALSKIPGGSLISYSSLAKRVGMSGATRAVATAVGRNPISYFIPCHRVVRKSGELGGYRWGLDVKQQLLKIEQAL